MGRGGDRIPRCRVFRPDDESFRHAARVGTAGEACRRRATPASASVHKASARLPVENSGPRVDKGEDPGRGSAPKEMGGISRGE
ncbi:hypothetical protein JQN58_36530 [Aneurinibacillus sp. BA2021]|nr:hypothetical protein [Aneurinibacillus sp. BA2021]